VAVVPFGFPSGSAIQTGDVLVSNFNNSGNLQGTGSTIIKLTANGTIAPNGSASVFFQGGPGLGLTTALGVLRKGFVIVGNVPTSDGTIATIKHGSLLVIDRNGKRVSTIPSASATTLDGPWDLTIFDEGDRALLFVSNVLNGTVSRLDLAIGKSVTVTSATRIAFGYTHEPNAAALILGPTGLAFNPYQDVLFVASTADNKIFRIDNAAGRTQAVARGTLVSQDSHLRGPLALAFAPNGDLLTANGDAVNADPTHPSEIVELTEAGRFVTEFNVDSGQGGAFGLAVGPTPVSFFSLAAVDDVTNSLQVYPLSR
jgi:DNA-binding beta-propeller fold protein YncE